MITEEFNIKRQEIVERFGEWARHNISLPNDTYTYHLQTPGHSKRVRSLGKRLLK